MFGSRSSLVISGILSEGVVNIGRIRSRIGPMLIARGLQLLQGFAVSTIILWRYGLESAGTYALSSFISNGAILFVAFGLPNSLPRSNLSPASRASAGLAITSGLIVASAVLACLYSIAFGNSQSERVALFCLALAGALGGQVNVLQMLFILQDRISIVIVAPFIHLCGGVLAAAAPTFPAFCIVLLAFRVIGNVAASAGLSYARTRLRDIGAVFREGLRYVPLDIVNLLADQVSTPLVAGLISRSELGLFGLVRQCLTLADSPGWSFVITNYPRLVADVEGNSAALARENQFIGLASAALCLIVSVILALGIYHQPMLMLAMPIVLLSLPARYANNFYDQALRAAGLVRDCFALSIVKIVISALLFFGLARLYGLWGAVSAISLLSLCGGALYAWRFRARFPGAVPLSFWRLA